MLILAFPDCIFRIITFMPCKLYYKTLGRKIRCDVNVKKNTIFLIFVLLDFQHLKLLYKFVRTLMALKESLSHIWEAVRDVKLTVLLLIMVGFWTMFNQLFYTLPTFIEDWVDTISLHAEIATVSPWLARLMSGGGMNVKPEMLINIDAGSIVLFQILVSMAVTHMHHVKVMIRGFLVAIIGVGLSFYFQNGLFTIVGIVIFAIGEMMTNPTFSSFVGSISPKGKEAMYQGTYFLPVAAGNFLTKFISGDLYQVWSDKATLLSRYFAEQHISALVINENYSKNQFYAWAEQQLGMTSQQISDLLWQQYQPYKIAYVIAGIGLLTCLALIVYYVTVIRVKEKAA